MADAGTASTLSVAIGRRVRRERQIRQWTLDQLSAAAGVSRRMVINVEQGDTNPSVGTLLRISNALGIGLPTLVAPPPSEAATVTRSGGGAILWSGHAGGQGVLVAGIQRPDVLELWDWTLEPGDRHNSEAHAAGTKELLQVQLGQVTVGVGDQEYTLNFGDALSFNGDAAHWYSNTAREPARFSLAVFEPQVGSSTRSGSSSAH